MKIEEIIEKFLIHLENVIMSLEKAYDTIDQKREDYNYSKNLLEILNVSKDAFLEGVLSRKEEEQVKLDEFLNRILNPNEVDKIYDAIKNLYYLKEYNLDTKDIPQIKDIEEIINRLKERLQDYQEKIERKNLDSLQEEISNNINNVILLGSAYEGNTQKEEIKDIDFLAKTVDSSPLTDEEKEKLLLHTLEVNAKLYVETLKNKKEQDTLLEDDLGKMLEEEQKEEEYSIKR